MDEEQGGSINIPVGNQVFDIAFHPEQDIVYAGLLTGEIKAFKYHDDGSYEQAFSIRPTKRSCRGLAINADGTRLYSVTKDKTIDVIDTATGSVLQSKTGAHAHPLSRVLCTLPYQLATGDDEGVLKLWDTRTLSQTHEYTHHSDFISDLLWLNDRKHLVVTSGDGTLSVLDVRTKKTDAWATSEDQEDELLSVVPIKGGTKLVVGTQLGILHIFDRKKGYGDCVDRIPGHPTSVDALVAITDDVVATGSSDGLIRMVQIHPTKFLGVVADHGEFPVERLRLDRRGKWLGSASHDDIVKLTDVEGALESSDEEDEKQGEEDSDEDDEDEDEDQKTGKVVDEVEQDGTEMETDDVATSEVDDEMSEAAVEEESVPEPAEEPAVPRTGRPLEAESDEEVEQPKKKKRKKKNKKGGGGNPAATAFFSGL